MFCIYKYLRSLIMKEDIIYKDVERWSESKIERFFIFKLHPTILHRSAVIIM